MILQADRYISPHKQTGKENLRDLIQIDWE